jgi:hypothetical protein
MAAAGFDSRLRCHWEVPVETLAMADGIQGRRAACRALAGFALAMLLAGCYCGKGDDCDYSPGEQRQKAVDGDAYRIVFHDVLPRSVGGPDLRLLVEAHAAEIDALRKADPALAAQARQLLEAWSLPTRFFIDGIGAEARVTQDMAEQFEDFLDALSVQASPELQSALTQERAARPAFDSLVGLDMNAFRAVMLPSLEVYRNGFE